MNLTEAKQLIVDKLKQDLGLIGENRRLAVETPVSIEDYKLTHPLGALLVVYRGSAYEENELANAVKQQRFISIGVIVVVRAAANYNNTEEWVDFVLNSVSALVSDGTGLTTVTDDEFLKEEGGIWWYGITAKIPSVFMKVPE